MNYLGKFLKKKLKQLKVSEREIAIKCGISHSYLNQLIKGVNPSTNRSISPTLTTFEKLSKGFGVSIEDLQRIARGCTESTVSSIDDKKINQSKNHEELPVKYSADVIAQIRDFQNFMSKLDIDITNNTEKEIQAVISVLKITLSNYLADHVSDKKSAIG